MKKWLMKFLFGRTRSSQSKQIRQLWLAVGIAFLLCAIIGALLYLLNKQGRI
jgi:O-antigen/teichoic acid export membrane protein